MVSYSSNKGVEIGREKNKEKNKNNNIRHLKKDDIDQHSYTTFAEGCTTMGTVYRARKKVTKERQKQSPDIKYQQK